MLHSLALALPLLLLPLGAQAAETVHGVVIFARHGDRTPKLYSPTKLTALGKNEMYDSGSFYRSRYIGNSTSTIPGIGYWEFSAAQLYAAAPDQDLLVTSGQAFLQGLYPPVTGSFAAVTTETLANGSVISPPLNGYQDATVHTISATDPYTIWLKGSDFCPKYTEASDNFYQSEQYTQLQATTKSFYESFSDILTGVFSTGDMSYRNAYAIFDYINVGVIHNNTIAASVSAGDLFQLRTLADSHEWALNGNITSTASPGALPISGRTLANMVLAQLGTIIDSKGEENKTSLLIGSYNAFLSFFALADLPKIGKNFRGLPDYASTMAFELISYGNSTAFPESPDDLYVRFLFRNGTAADIIEYPIFSQPRSAAVMPWSDFHSHMAGIAVSSVPEWCMVCGSTDSFCPVGSDNGSDNPDVATAETKLAVSPVVAGVIGAMVTLSVVGLLSAVMIGCGARLTWNKRRTSVEGLAVGGRSMSDSGSESVIMPGKVEAQKGLGLGCYL